MHIEQERSVLRRSDYRILVAGSGEEALKIHRIEKTDIIIVDLDMPGIAGDKLCSQIKKDRSLRDVYVILVCRDEKEDIKRCIKSKADFYMTKPIDNGLLLEKLREVLHIRTRGAERIPLKISIVGSADKTFSCYARDLSSSGILIETDRILHKGDSLGCLFCLGNSREIVVNGVVARIRIMSNHVYQYGIKFSLLSSKSQAAMEEVIRKFA